MFELYSYEAIYALNEALKLAQNSNSPYIEPGHILLGLRREGLGSAARFMRAKGVSFDDLNLHFNQGFILDKAAGNIELSESSREILTCVYENAMASGCKLVGQNELFIKLVEKSELISSVLKKLNAMPTKETVELYDSPEYEGDLNLSAPGPLLLQKLQAFNLFEMICLHSAFLNTGAFKVILVKNLDITLKEKLLAHLSQKYVVQGELVVCDEDVSAVPIQINFGDNALHGWSWDEDQIEFNIQPDKFRDTRLKIAILDFMIDIAKLLMMPISLAEDGIEYHPDIKPDITVNPDGSMKIPESEMIEEFGSIYFNH